MDRSFWTERWESGEIGFHQPDVNDLLKLAWPRIGVPPGGRVFVPLCGKSIDMAWLAAAGHPIVGAELSPLAVSAFFKERGLMPLEHSAEAALKCMTAGPFSLWQGDFFALEPRSIGDVAAVYDRASLVAFPPARQKEYVDKLLSLIPPGTPLLLVGLDFDPSEMAGPPFPTERAKIETLFGPNAAISVLESRNGLEASDNLRKRGLTRLWETAYLIRT